MYLSSLTYAFYFQIPADSVFLTARNIIAYPRYFEKNNICYHPAAQPSALGSEAPQSTPSSFLRMICPLP